LKTWTNSLSRFWLESIHGCSEDLRKVLKEQGKTK
jgi:hypothetical protein